MSNSRRDPPAAASTSPKLSPVPSRSPISESRSPLSKNPSLRIPHMPSTAAQHRQSIGELRGHPPSPRSQRHPSLSQLAVQDLIDNPPGRNNPDPRFAGRDWRAIHVSELTSPDDLKFVEVDTGVEAATNLLIDSGVPALLIREDSTSQAVISTFGHADLNAYLLLVVGLAQPDEEHISDFQELARKAREGRKIPLKDVQDLARKEPLTFLPHTADLIRAVEVFGHGVHRILIQTDGTDHVVGVLSQSRLVKFLWENGRSFPVIDQLYPQYLRDLKIGSHDIISINGDRPLSDALTLLLTEGVSSLAVIDNGRNVVGNISTTDVQLLTKSSSLPLLRNTCIHFISVILSTRGMYEGKDSFPVFHVTPLNTLAHTVAKLVATKSHRMWITEPVSPSSSGPPTPSLGHAQPLMPTSSHNSAPTTVIPPTVVSAHANHIADASPKVPAITPAGPSVSASSLPGARIGGHLVGVVSLTDILILFAKASGLLTLDPGDIRKGRRRTSSSSSVRKSIDLGPRPRASGEYGRPGWPGSAVG